MSKSSGRKVESTQLIAAFQVAFHDSRLRTQSAVQGTRATNGPVAAPHGYRRSPEHDVSEKIQN